MKKLYLVRHAKSSWKDMSLEDFKRPLNHRGKRDAPFMAKIFRQKYEEPDVIISSPAKRARKTAEAFAVELGVVKSNIKLNENIYEASSNELFRILTLTDQSINSIMLFGHNPGLTSLSNQLSEKYIDNIPTCGIVGIQFDVEWKNVSPSSGKFLFFEYPKLYFR